MPSWTFLPGDLTSVNQAVESRNLHLRGILGVGYRLVTDLGGRKLKELKGGIEDCSLNVRVRWSGVGEIGRSDGVCVCTQMREHSVTSPIPSLICRAYFS